MRGLVSSAEPNGGERPNAGSHLTNLEEHATRVGMLWLKPNAKTNRQRRRVLLFKQILFHCGEDELADQGPRPTWGAISKTRRGGHLHLGRCFSVVASAHNVLTDDGGRRTLFSFVVLGGHERHIFWAESEEERNAWVHDIQAVIGAGDHLTALHSPARHQSPPMAVHDHAFWDTALWELRSAHQIQLEHEKDGIRSSVGLVCSGTRVSKILPGSPASKSLRCFHSNEEIQLEVDDEILEVNNETVLPDTCASMLRGDDVVGSMVRIKVRKSSNPSPIARAVASRLTTPGQSPSAASPSRSSISASSVQRLMTPGQTPFAASPSRSSINSSSPYRDTSQLGAGEHVIDLVTVPLISLLSFQAMTQTIENLKDLEGSGPLVAKLQKQADGLIESLEAYSSYTQSHVKGLEDVFHGEMALAANRENTWVNINTRLVKEIEQLREKQKWHDETKRSLEREILAAQEDNERLQKELADAMDPASIRMIEKMIEGALYKVAPSHDSYDGKHLLTKCEDLIAALGEVGKLVDNALESFCMPDARESTDWHSRSLARKMQLMANLCSTLEDRRSSSSIAGEQMLRRILQIQLLLAELLQTEEDISPVEMAKRVALLFRDKEEAIDTIDELVGDSLDMTADERARKTVVNKVRELAMAHNQRVDRPQCTVATQTGEDTWIDRIVRTGTLFLFSGAPIQKPSTKFTVIPGWAENVRSSQIHQPPNSPRFTGRSAWRKGGDMLSPRIVTPRGRFSPRIADDPNRTSVGAKSTSPTWHASLTNSWSTGRQLADGERVKPYTPASPAEADNSSAKSTRLESDESNQVPDFPISYPHISSGPSAVPALNLKSCRLDRSTKLINESSSTVTLLAYGDRGSDQRIFTSYEDAEV